MMKKLGVFLALTVLATAAQAASLKQGTREIGVSGLLDPSGGDGADIMLAGSYGYFIQDNIEVGGGAGYADISISTTYSLYGFGEYNFDLGGPMVPFAGAQLGWAKTEVDLGLFEVDQDAVELALYGGAKYFLAENIAISGQLNLKVASEDIYVNDDDADSVDVTLTLGMRFFLP